MELSVPQELLLGIIASFRYLTCLHPYVAEKDWVCSQLLLDNPEGPWVEMREPDGRVGYIYRKGRYTNERPADTPENQITVINTPPGPYARIREFLGQVIERIEESSSEQLKRKENFRQKRALLSAMTEFFFEKAEVVKLLAVFPQDGAGDGAAASALSEYLTELRERHIDFTLPGSFIGRASALHELLKVSPSPDALMDSIIADFRRGGVKDSGLVFSLIRPVLDALLRQNNRWELIEQALDQLESSGDERQKSARSANTIGQFYGNLFEGCPYFFSAMEIYRYLSELPVIPEEKREWCRIRKNASEELFLRGFDAMRADFSNHFQNGVLLTHHRALIAQTRAEQGDFAAEQLANEKTGFSLLYPSFWKPFLLSESDILPSRSG